jgi:putative Mg2+ transporter-C (MgtC) family protein
MESIGSHLAQLGVAYALALPIGWDREKESGGAGLRTFSLVCVASCAMMLIGREAIGTEPEVKARVLQGLMAGIGFIGGGAILKSEHSVHGTATAASIWNVGVIGAAVAMRLYDIAAVLALVNFLTLWLLRPIKNELQKKSRRDA